jgi:uncharacterized repeat protein (TIGR03803 family)
MVRHTVCLLTALLLGLPFVAQADYRVLHHFAGSATDGAKPLGSLFQTGEILYGMTISGGTSGGTIFRINTDGTDFQLMHSFNSSGAGGSRPYGTLIQVGVTLYGMAGSENNATYKGALFSIGLDGSDYEVVHTFAGPPSDGKWPYDSLIESDSVLYGMTVCGGNGDRSASGGVWGGTVFKVNTDGTAYQILHHFRGGATDGTWSPGNLVKSESILYGMTFGGGGNGLGTIFRINTDGTDFGLLHSFVGGQNDGGRSHSSLILSDSILYGLTSIGGTNNLGIIFRINTDGTDFQILHSFAGGANDGSGPIAGSLVQSGSMLYGMTTGGGAGDNGVVFQMGIDGTNFLVLHSFNGENGAKPFGAPLLSGSTLYGMTSAGGSRNQGVLFSLDLPRMRLVPDEHPTIQGAIDAAGTGDVIQVAQGIYYENISFIDKNMVLQSIDPDDPYYIGGTIIQGDVNDPVLTLDNNSQACEIAGLTLRAGAVGISGIATNTSIRNCRIMDNVTDGIELSQQSNPYLQNCLIAANGRTGIKMLPGSGRGSPPCKPVIENCVIVDNSRASIEGGEPVIIDSIIQ